MRIIHRNDVVLATVDGADIQGTLRALGLSVRDVQVLVVDDSTAARLQTHHWTVQQGRLVIGEVVQTAPAGNSEELPRTDAERLTRLERFISDLRAQIESITTRP